jgi:hypothetical protein
MKRITIICEGPTEVEFCKELLFTHFLGLNIQLHWSLPKWSMGGDISWHNLHKQIEFTLKQDPSTFVTTFIDLYGLQNPEKFPNWNEALFYKQNPYKRIEILENAMKDAFPENLRNRFIPNYILHEFEGLLFNDIQHFENVFDNHEFKNKNELIKVLNQFDNPELINEKKESSPSHRLNGVIFHKFNKTIGGILIALDIQLYKIRQKSPHFNNWITKLENLK